jgi:hypothetical protein
MRKRKEEEKGKEKRGHACIAGLAILYRLVTTTGTKFSFSVGQADQVPKLQGRPIAQSSQTRGNAKNRWAMSSAESGQKGQAPAYSRAPWRGEEVPCARVAVEADFFVFLALFAKESHN